MQWTDDAIVLGIRRHGEASAIAELFTREHGRHLGLVRGGFGSRLKPALQPGNTVRAVWRARLDEHLGNYTIEPETKLGQHLHFEAGDLRRDALRIVEPLEDRFEIVIDFSVRIALRQQAREARQMSHSEQSMRRCEH